MHLHHSASVIIITQQSRRTLVDGKYPTATLFNNISTLKNPREETNDSRLYPRIARHLRPSNPPSRNNKIVRSSYRKGKSCGRGDGQQYAKPRSEEAGRRPANHADQIVGRSCQRGLTVTRPRQGEPKECLYMQIRRLLKADRSSGRSLGIDSQI